MSISEANKRKDAGSAQTTPSKIAVGKKNKDAALEAEVLNLTILKAIQSLEKNVNNREQVKARVTA